MRSPRITARIIYPNWPRVVFGFLGAMADEIRAADVTALAGFPRIEVDPWLWGMTEALIGLESCPVGIGQHLRQNR
jgi:hypothetical protein